MVEVFEPEKALREQIERRILVLDGAMGTQIQALGLQEDDYRGSRFAEHDRPLRGCNDVLSLTQPQLIEQIHLRYLAAGADIIETNTFNSNAISLADYGLSEHVAELNRAAVRCARRALNRFGSSAGRPRFIAGSIGPTNRTASIAPNSADSTERDVSFEQLASAYQEQVAALIEAGVDILMPETAFDTLNLKACLFAIQKCFEEYGRRLPVIASATISDRSGRTLSGQTLEAFWISVSHAELFAIGLNCGLGPEPMRPFIEELSGLVPIYTSCHPNAGIPNDMGEYDLGPQAMADVLGQFAAEGWVNIVGGCCGSTPEHIAAVAAALDRLEPRRPKPRPRYMQLSGLEPLEIRPDSNLILIAERTNVMGSRQFARLIREGRFEQAVQIARQQLQAGANIIDVCMDEAMLEGEWAMQKFLNAIGSDPEVARVPVMIDSSKWSVIEAGLKCLQGKGIVNSISLKEGEEQFIEQARAIRRYGSAVVVMAFDEAGQATSIEHKVRIAERAYRLLTERAGFDPNDIIFDPNVLAVGTGIEEHNHYAINFIEATRQIKQKLPEMKVSGGVSNLSFAFRGNNVVREAMHAAFLYHARAAGLDMAIVNPAALAVYEQISPELLERVEDVLFDRRPDATARLVELASTRKDTQAEPEPREHWRSLSLEERIRHAMVHGIEQYIEADVTEARDKYGTCLAVIEGPLMDGMRTVGELFGQGKMFLPQVVRSARVMRRAVQYLEPFMQREQQQGCEQSKARAKVLLATVKGDVHDIGKNIVGTVLSCNNYEVIDLGVMVPGEQILRAAREHQVDAIGLSGLITPSLEEMVHVAGVLGRAGLDTPLLIGGATTSPVHTATKIAPAYGHTTVHVPDASRCPAVLESLLSPAKKEQFAEQIRAEQEQLVASYRRRQRRRIVPFEQACAQRFACDWQSVPIQQPAFLGLNVLDEFPLDELVHYIDWSPLFWAWDMRGRYPSILEHPEKGAEARRLLDDARRLLDQIVEGRLLKARAVYGFWPANAELNDVLLWADEQRSGPIERLPMLRQQWQRRGQKAFYSLADFVAPIENRRLDFIGAFALSSGFGSDELVRRFKRAGDDYRAILAKVLADRLAEAFAERLHQIVRQQWYAPDEKLSIEELLAEKYRGIRPAPGYPACPDHSEKARLFRLLEVQTRVGMRLTENFAMIPAASICGWFFAHPQGRYFAIDAIGRDQLQDYARRKGEPAATVERWLSHWLAYEP